jgi:glycosyltransferase involved in cell wall biosynthesis
VSVERFSIRAAPAGLVDSADLEEEGRTRVLLRAGPLVLLSALVATALGAPLSCWRALRAAFRCGRRSDRGVLRHLIYLAEACLLLRWLRAAGDIRHLHAHFGTNSAVVAMLSRMLGGPPYSFTVHGPEEFDHPFELSLAEKVDRAAAVIAVSDFGRSQIYRWIPHGEWPKVHVIRCGVDAGFLAAGPQPIQDNRRLVCVGRIAAQKGQLLIVEALSVLAAEGAGFELVLAGDGPMRAEVERRVRELGLQTAVHITGWISGDDVRQQLMASRVLLLPSFAEGLPVVLMEALALGRPVISTYVAGIPELVAPGVNGWLVPAGSLDALVGAIKQALEASPAELGRMGRNGAAAVAAHHDAVEETARLAALFRQVPA